MVSFPIHLFAKFRPPIFPFSIATGDKTVEEETYERNSLLESILISPSEYIGSTEKHTEFLWVYEDDEMVQRSVTYVPGLCQIFDNILLNAVDNKQRDPEMKALRVNIDAKQNVITVYNNGDAIPVEIHEKTQVYLPELCFGRFYTSTNFDDSKKKTTAGRHGFGAKLTNIFSTQLVIETADGQRQKKYKQVFSNNMRNKSEPEITECKESENWTKVSFKPDLSKFNMTTLDENDAVAMMKKRVFEMAVFLGKTVKVKLNGKRVPVKSFVEYVGLYLASVIDSKSVIPPRIVERVVNHRWDICMSLSDGNGFQQVSFVNGIATTEGGTHVDYITNQIADHILAIVNRKSMTARIDADIVKNHLWVFVSALIDNPEFDSYSKLKLIHPQSSFGSKCELSDKFLKRVAKCGIVENILSWANSMEKTHGAEREKISGILKLGGISNVVQPKKEPLDDSASAAAAMETETTATKRKAVSCDDLSESKKMMVRGKHGGSGDGPVESGAD